MPALRSQLRLTWSDLQAPFTVELFRCNRDSAATLFFTSLLILFCLLAPVGTIAKCGHVISLAVCPLIVAYYIRRLAQLEGSAPECVLSCTPTALLDQAFLLTIGAGCSLQPAV